MCVRARKWGGGGKCRLGTCIYQFVSRVEQIMDCNILKLCCLAEGLCMVNILDIIKISIFLNVMPCRLLGVY